MDRSDIVAEFVRTFRGGLGFNIENRVRQLIHQEDNLPQSIQMREYSGDEFSTLKKMRPEQSGLIRSCV
jgi:hypothetical protein